MQVRMTGMPVGPAGPGCRVCEHSHLSGVCVWGWGGRPRAGFVPALGGRPASAWQHPPQAAVSAVQQGSSGCRAASLLQNSRAGRFAALDDACAHGRRVASLPSCCASVPAADASRVPFNGHRHRQLSPNPQPGQQGRGPFNPPPPPSSRGHRVVRSTPPPGT